MTDMGEFSERFASAMVRASVERFVAIIKNLQTVVDHPGLSPEQKVQALDHLFKHSLGSLEKIASGPADESTGSPGADRTDPAQ